MCLNGSDWSSLLRGRAVTAVVDDRTEIHLVCDLVSRRKAQCALSPATNTSMYLSNGRSSGGFVDVHFSADRIQTSMVLTMAQTEENKEEEALQDTQAA